MLHKLEQSVLMDDYRGEFPADSTTTSTGGLSQTDLRGNLADTSSPMLAESIGDVRDCLECGDSQRQHSSTSELNWLAGSPTPTAQPGQYKFGVTPSPITRIGSGLLLSATPRPGCLSAHLGGSNTSTPRSETLKQATGGSLHQHNQPVPFLKSQSLSSGQFLNQHIEQRHLTAAAVAATSAEYSHSNNNNHNNDNSTINATGSFLSGDNTSGTSGISSGAEEFMPMHNFFQTTSNSIDCGNNFPPNFDASGSALIGNRSQFGALSPKQSEMKKYLQDNSQSIQQRSIQQQLQHLDFMEMQKIIESNSSEIRQLPCEAISNNESYSKLYVSPVDENPSARQESLKSALFLDNNVPGLLRLRSVPSDKDLMTAKSSEFNLCSPEQHQQRSRLSAGNNKSSYTSPLCETSTNESLITSPLNMPMITMRAAAATDSSSGSKSGSYLHEESGFHPPPLLGSLARPVLGQKMQRHSYAGPGASLNQGYGNNSLLNSKSGENDFLASFRQSTSSEEFQAAVTNRSCLQRQHSTRKADLLDLHRLVASNIGEFDSTAAAELASFGSESTLGSGGDFLHSNKSLASTTISDSTLEQLRLFIQNQELIKLLNNPALPSHSESSSQRLSENEERFAQLRALQACDAGRSLILNRDSLPTGTSNAALTVDQRLLNTIFDKTASSSGNYAAPNCLVNDYNNNNVNLGLDRRALLAASLGQSSGFSIDRTNNFGILNNNNNSSSSDLNNLAMAYKLLFGPFEREIEKAAQNYRNSASFVAKQSEAAYHWSGKLPSRNFANASFAKKVFLGGVPWDITSEDLVQTFQTFGDVSVVWPNREHRSLFQRSQTLKGYCYIVFGDELSVKMLLENCILDPNFSGAYYRMSSLKFKTKDVQVIPWVLSDAVYTAISGAKPDPKKTVFVGALHGMLTAECLFIIMNDLFGNVVMTALDTDKHKYPIGSGRVVFGTSQSYFRAVTANFVEIKTPKFNKTIQIDPYLEDSVCNNCYHQPGIYFCRSFECFRYLCLTCWQGWHNNSEMANHKPLRRSFKLSTSGDKIS